MCAHGPGVFCMLVTGFAAGLPPLPAVLLTLALALVLARIAVIDAATLRIPDRLSLPLIAAGLVLAFAGPGGFGPAHLAGAIAGFVLFAVIGEGYFRLRGIDGLGLGDAKLFAAAGAWLGWRHLALVLLIAAVACLLAALLRPAARRGGALAFGPWLALGFLAVWVWTCWGGRI